MNNIVGPQTGPCILFETYQSTAVPSMYNATSNTWFMSGGLHYVLNSNEIAASASTLDNGAQDSPGIPMVPLLIRYSEVPLGVQHPLRITFPSPTNWFVWPGTGCCAGSGPPQGLLYRLKASVNWQAACPVSTSPQAATLLQALQQYGAYMSDHGSAGYVQGVPDVRWDDNDVACIKNFHVSDLEVVDNSALEVSAISGQTKPYVVPAILPNGAVGTAYSATFSAVGGSPTSRHWSVSSGAIPPGLLLDASAGTLTASPTSSTGSPYSFSISLTDTASGLASQAQAFSIAVTGGTTKGTPVLTWPQPAAITFGGSLGSSQLNATANVPGSFVYSPPAGTVLGVGNGQVLSVTFTPTASNDFVPVTTTRTIDVLPGPGGPAKLVITQTLARDGSNNVVATVTVANSGGTAAQDVTLTAARIGTTAGTPLPQALGAIAPGGMVHTTIAFPASVGASGTGSSLTVAGTYTGATISSSARIVLP